jgi:hypothetical protein
MSGAWICVFINTNINMSMHLVTLLRSALTGKALGAIIA